MVIPIIIVVVLIIALAGVLVYIGLQNPSRLDEKLLQQRLNEYSQRGEELNLEKIELSQPFFDRVIYPFARSLGELAIKFTPQNTLQNISTKLELAGSPSKLDPTLFLSIQIGAVLLFSFIIILVFRIGQTQWPFGRVLLFAAGFGVLGYFFPQLWLSSKISRRQKDVRRAMPDALDLLTICVEAGLGFDAAMAKVSDKWKTDLSLAFARAIQEIQLGKIRREALRDMADRLGVPEMTSFVAAVIQSDQLGVSLAKVLRIQSDQMRVKRRQFAEEEAHKAPIKMLIPMVLLIFPSLMIVLLSPAGFRLFHSALGGMIK